MASIPVGARGSFTLVVTAEHLANRFKDATLPPVLATPVMIMAMENAALNAIKPYLGAHESAVGTRVDVLHLAATPVGRQVVAGAKVTKVEGRRIEFYAAVRRAAESRKIAAVASGPVKTAYVPIELRASCEVSLRRTASAVPPSTSAEDTARRAVMGSSNNTTPARAAITGTLN